MHSVLETASFIEELPFCIQFAIYMLQESQRSALKTPRKVDIEPQTKHPFCKHLVSKTGT